MAATTEYFDNTVNLAADIQQLNLSFSLRDKTIYVRSTE